MPLGMFDRNKSYRPKAAINKNTRRYTLHKYAKNSLGVSTNLAQAVKCPPTESVEEWYAVHVIDFYNKLNLILGPLEETIASDRSTMSAGKFEYLWKDTNQYRRATALPALQYINLTLEYIETRVNDPSIFPVEDGAFPRNYVKVVKEIFKKIFRVFAHLFIERFRVMVKMGISAHVSTVFKHFMLFVFEFNMIKKRELMPMNDWILQNLGESYRSQLRIQRRRRNRS